MTFGAIDNPVRDVGTTSPHFQHAWMTRGTTTAVPDLLAILGEAGIAAAEFNYPESPFDARAERLRDLAKWSVTEADLDWDHADRIDETGWGLTD